MLTIMYLFSCPFGKIHGAHELHVSQTLLLKMKFNLGYEYIFSQGREKYLVNNRTSAAQMGHPPRQGRVWKLASSWLWGTRQKRSPSLS